MTFSSTGRRVGAPAPPAPLGQAKSTGGKESSQVPPTPAAPPPTPPAQAQASPSARPSQPTSYEEPPVHDRARVLIGLDAYQHDKKNVEAPVHWDESEVVNHHIGLAGISGSGKTYWIRKFVAAVVNARQGDVEVDILDYHGDIDIPGAKEVLFSERTRYGYNPLVLNTDPDFGGVRRGVTDVVSAIVDTSSAIGVKQNSVLQNLVYDTYALYGIDPNVPETWIREDMSREEKIRLSESGTTPEQRAAASAAIRARTYPSLDDVASLARRKLKALWMGVEDSNSKTGARALDHFEAYCRSMQEWNKWKKVQREVNAALSDDLEKLEKRVEEAKNLAIATHTMFLETITTGREFEDIIKYQSKDVILSVLNRLDSLIKIGLFNHNPPPFGNARIRRYNLKPMAQSEKELRMFVQFRLNAIIREEKERGESHGRIRRLIVLDEAKRFNDEENNNPINVIATEMRKFGVGLLMASQSPAHFSQDFIKMAGTMMLLTISTSDWGEAARKLQIDKEKLQYLRSHETGSIRLLRAGQPTAFREVKFIKPKPYKR